MNIREAKPEDGAALQAINQESLGYDYPLEKTKEQLNELLAVPDNKLLVCTMEEQVCGYIHAAVYETIYAPKMINILALSVATAAQGAGCGKALMGAAEKWAVQLDAAGIRLNSGEERSAAHRFYEHIGFTKRKNQANYYKLFE